MSIHIPRGTADVLPGEVELWQFIEQKSRDLCQRFNYKEIRTPIFEHTELFQRGVGETTDIVEKEMYTFQDKGGRNITLRPEGTAAVVRSFAEHKLFGDPNQPVKLYYIGPMFRYERPQAGRMRQFTQFGVEALGSYDPSIDAEVIALAMGLYEELGIHDLRLEVNSVGCNTCRPVHRDHLVQHLGERREELCADCQSRFDRNPLRILDCKAEKCKEITKQAPNITEHLCDDCSPNFEQVKEHLTRLGIAYHVNPRMVRGLDYYTQTAFEIMAEGFGAITTICGGGRYNGLVESIGGHDSPGIGFAMSIERVLLTLQSQKIELPVKRELDCYVVAVGEQAEKEAVCILNKLRKHGLRADKDYQGRRMRAQFKAADRNQARVTLIIGDDELEKGIAVVRTMATGEQQEVNLNEVVNFIATNMNTIEEEK
ncbi:histidine--tRNA ligase [Ammoniphilus oxalaticus]|uniref:Histidine--tRNA ligase n=1 Tax=Ammoniphilus oxalaticus TaxID=66863 RepID=A0A419SJ01_9BACL|nr:histidine--tRNA ligase [Ammoniphilus oxalaticus]RKD23932.1 histidine--tRNA ligase [Ammoniphilus oxalaticus]